MNLNKLIIERIKYGDDVGSFKGTVSFDNEKGKVDIVLSPEHCEKIFAVVADGIVDTAKEAAKNLCISVVEHKKTIGGDS